MKVALFTSNHPRHLRFINSISSIVDELFVVQETKPMFSQSDVGKQKYLTRYMELMTAAELEVFGDYKFHKSKNLHISVGLGEASKLNFSVFKEIMDCDFLLCLGVGFYRENSVSF